MKTYKNLFTQVTTFETLYQAFRLARRGKRDRAAVADFEFNSHSTTESLSKTLRALNQSAQEEP